MSGDVSLRIQMLYSTEMCFLNAATNEEERIDFGGIRLIAEMRESFHNAGGNILVESA